MAPKTSTVLQSTAVFKIIEVLARILLLLLLTDSVIGHVSDGTTDKKADSSLASFSPSSHPQSTHLTESDVYTVRSQFSPVNTQNIHSSETLNSATSSNIAQSSSKNSSSGYSLQQSDSDPPKNKSLISPATKSTNIITEPPISQDDHLSTPSISLSSTINKTNLFVQQQQRQQQLSCSGCPYIDHEASPNVTALLGKMAYLTCRVKNLGDKTVSWVRHRDIHLLTIGRYTYTTDQRYRAILQPSTDDYTLLIKYPQHRDSGIYECQVSTTPHLSHYVHLSVVEPITEVVGGPDLFIDRGSTINLTCTVKFSPEPPSYIIWNHNNAIISYNSPRGGVSVLTEKGETTTSYLLIQQAKSTDSGYYSCNPSNAAPHSIHVHVLNGEMPAAMQTGGQMPQKIPLSLCLLFSVVLIYGTS